MAIAFFTPLSQNFSRKLVNFTDFNNLIDICINNIYELYSSIKHVHDSSPYNLETCQVRSICVGWKTI